MPVDSVNGGTSEPHTGIPANFEVRAAGLLVAEVTKSDAGGMTDVPAESGRTTDVVGAAD